MQVGIVLFLEQSKDAPILGLLMVRPWIRKTEVFDRPNLSSLAPVYIHAKPVGAWLRVL